jgi:predicted TIM-barrel fold metal-dependent hydrolase
MAELIERLPGTVLIDHMARLPQPDGIEHPAFPVVRRLLDTGRFWVKLSGPYLDAREGAPRYPQIAPIARAYVAHAPERCVWGSDWPHPTERDAKPDDAELLDLLQDWAPNRSAREKILVRNPTVLYGFGS